MQVSIIPNTFETVQNTTVLPNSPGMSGFRTPVASTKRKSEITTLQSCILELNIKHITKAILLDGVDKKRRMWKFLQSL